MSGRTKGKRGEREAIRALRAAGLDARGVRRERGATPDVDVVIFDRHGEPWLAVQVKREEAAPARVREWIAVHVAPARALMLRRNRAAWVVVEWCPLAGAPIHRTVEEWAEILGRES